MRNGDKKGGKCRKATILTKEINYRFLQEVSVIQSFSRVSSKQPREPGL
jgi:hypothetical protein